MNLLYRKWRSLLFRIRYKLSQLSDKIKGVDFTTSVSCEAAGIFDVPGAQYYASSGFAPELKAALDYLKITPRDTILDYGSGKGGALKKLHQYPFGKVAGVELSASLAMICRQNLMRLHIDDIEIIVQNAIEFNDIDGFNYFYFFNPFGPEVLRKVLDNILESTSRIPRNITLIYNYPKYAEVFNQAGPFLLSKVFVDGARKINIYNLNREARLSN